MILHVADSAQSLWKEAFEHIGEFTVQFHKVRYLYGDVIQDGGRTAVEVGTKSYMGINISHR